MLSRSWVCVLVILSSGLRVIAGNTLNVPQDYPTIQSAIVAAANGDTIVVQPGSYNQSIHYLGKNVIITSIDPNDPGLVESTTIEGSVTFLGSEQASASLRGFRVLNSAGGNGTSATIQNCIFRSPVGGLDGDILDCTISAGGSFGFGHNAIWNCNGNIRRCVVQGWGTAFANCNGLVANCLVTRNIIGFGWGEARVSGCTVVGNRDYGFSQNFGGTIENSIVWSNWLADLQSPNASVSYSCIGNPESCSDPSFVSPGHWDFNGQIFWVEGTDYRLLPDSSLIDVGDPQLEFDPTDFDLGGNPRVFNGRVDVGAYESQFDECSGEDFDSDGYPDECDPDSDGDGVGNRGDVCGFTSSGTEVDFEGRPRGDLDGDCRNALSDYAVFQRGFTGP